jgi:hypothetical protein
LVGVNSTRVDLEHRHLERLGVRAAEMNRILLDFLADEQAPKLFAQRGPTCSGGCADRARHRPRSTVRPTSRRPKPSASFSDKAAEADTRSELSKRSSSTYRVPPSPNRRQAVTDG